MKTPDYQKEPFRHPAVWPSHLVRHTRDYPNGEAWNVATCECGWSHRERVDDTAARWKAAKKAGTDPRNDAVCAHWRDVISRATTSVVPARAEAAPA